MKPAKEIKPKKIEKPNNVENKKRHGFQNIEIPQKVVIPQKTEVPANLNSFLDDLLEQKSSKPNVHFSEGSIKSDRSQIPKPPPLPPLASIPEKIFDDDDSDEENNHVAIFQVPDPRQSLKRASPNSFPPPPPNILYDIPPRSSSTRVSIQSDKSDSKNDFKLY